MSQRRMPTALTPEDRENQLINLAMGLAEKQLRDGTASSQVISHFLKVASLKEQKELELISNQNELLKAKTEAIQSGKRIEALYSEALNAMREYGGNTEKD